MTTRIDYEKELNPEQLAAVREGDGPCVVLAGAGSGKTRTVVYRVAGSSSTAFPRTASCF
jgi:DNA helicase-2/ATP-dependent DNA helicase PcrA